MVFMKVVSLNVGRPRTINYRDRTIETGIYKDPVEGRVKLRPHNLEGDEQADLTVHGGLEKAVYGYPFEHYEYWKNLLGDIPFGWGAFGENLTTSGITEDSLNIGDTLRIGSATLMVRQPRLPCFKLAAKFERDNMIDLFYKSGRCGFYFSIEEEGDLGGGDAIEPKYRDPNNVTVADVNRLFLEKENTELLEHVLRAPALSAWWRRHFEERLEGGR